MRGRLEVALRELGISGVVCRLLRNSEPGLIVLSTLVGISAGLAASAIVIVAAFVAIAIIPS